MIEHQSETRVVTLPLRWEPGYFGKLIGTRIPALVEDGIVLAGLLVAVEEGPERVTLTFAQLEEEHRDDESE